MGLSFKNNFYFESYWKMLTPTFQTVTWNAESTNAFIISVFQLLIFENNLI